jgi:cobalamin synthase
MTMKYANRSGLPDWLQPLLIALQFLTRIPMPDTGRVDDAAVGRSLLWYPLATLLLFAGLRGLMIQRIGGTTGDTAGALVELSEAMTLLALLILI